jgi:hypothetical protein
VLSGLYVVLIIVAALADFSAYGGGRHYRAWRERA